jgi:hypothetical protein
VSGPRWNAIQWVASVAALIGVLAAVSKGFAADRLRPVVPFAVLWTACATGAVVARAALQRRAARLKKGSVPRGVRLRERIWIALANVFEILLVAGPLGAIAAVLGFSGVGIGIVVALAALFVPMLITDWFMRIDLTFETEGLRVHKRRLNFAIPWTSIVDVEIVAAANPPLHVEIAEPHRLLATVEPDNPQNRRRLQFWLAVWSHSGRTVVVFHNWTAGLDSASLKRAIREAMGEPLSSLN